MEGVRTIFSFWIVALHTVTLFCFLTYTGKADNLELLDTLPSTLWVAISLGMGLQVDVFFMLSGFLMSWNLLRKGQSKGSLQVDFIMLMLKRLLRLWPAVLVSMVLMVVLGDMFSDDWWVMLRALSFPKEVSQPSAFTVNWSTGVDLKCSVFLFLTVIALQRMNALTVGGSMLAALLSLLPKVVLFAQGRHLVSYILIGRSGNPADAFVPIFMSEERQRYFCDSELYPAAAQHYCAFIEGPSLVKQTVLANDYFSFHQRMTPFFIGLVLAVALHAADTGGEEGRLRAKRWLKQAWHGLCLLLAVLFALFPVILAFLTSGKKVVPLAPGVLPKISVDFIITALNRPIYSAALAYLLYRCLLPADHPQHLRWLNALLSSPVLKGLGIFSYGVYTIHMKILVDMAYRYLPLGELDGVCGDSAFCKFLVWLGATYGVSLGIAVCTHYAVEKPFHKHVSQPLLRAVGGLLGEKKEKEQ